MWMLSGFAALGCLLYWILILFYSGADTGFVWFWLGAAVGLGVLFTASLFYRQRKVPQKHCNQFRVGSSGIISLTVLSHNLP